MNRVLSLLLFFLMVSGCSHPDKDLTRFVDPFIGTGGDGHTFPGAIVPFGMTQLSPDTRISGPDYAAGYHYTDSVILGFSHTHYSGTGRGSGGDIMFMPFTGAAQIPAAGTHHSRWYASTFSHAAEASSPGYYKVLLADPGITAELTTSRHTGVHRYTYPEKKKAGIVLDLTHGINDKADSLYLKIIDNRTIAGMRKSTGGLRMYQTIYFMARFSIPFTSFGIFDDGKVLHEVQEASGKDVQAWFLFGDAGEITLKVALSKVGIDGAGKNLTEVKNQSFEEVREKAREDWNKELGKITITTGNVTLDTLFYTALYHSCIMPSLDTDIDGRYRSTNHKIYKAKGFASYTNFSLWDTFRALHPLMTLINPLITRDFINTFIERYEHSGSMPIFELSGNDLLVMIGYHSLPVIADAYVKGIGGFDVQKALAGMKGLADMPFEERNEYKTFGYIPYDLTGQAVSRTLEFAYDDWCLAQVAKGNDEKAWELYSHRGNFFRNLFDKKTHFMRPKDRKSQWLEDFDPAAYTRKYTQGNAWQYTTFVPQDIAGMISLMGGDQKFEEWLDRFFTEKNGKTYQRKTSSLLIGQYYHGNEPSHHVAYLYNYAGAAWKTQRMVRRILDTQYSVSPEGLAGNDDAGQISAWYVLSSLGFYSVTPGTDYYVIGSPLFTKAEIHLQNRKTFTIIAHRKGPGDIYIQSATLNGKPYPNSFIRHRDILAGGTLVFEMGSHPNTTWAKKKINRPTADEFNDVSIPVISITGKNIGRDGVVTFKDNCHCSASCITPGAVMHYTTDGTEPATSSKKITGNIIINSSCLLKIKAFKKGRIPSYTTTVKFRKLDPQPPINVENPKKGIKYEYREVWVCKKTDQIDQYPVLRSGITASISSDLGFRMALNRGLVFSGYVYTPVTGTYTFFIDTEYAASLKIDNELIASNESTDWLGERSGTIALQKGFHKILVKDYQTGPENGFKLLWKAPGIEKQEISGAYLWH